MPKKNLSHVDAAWLHMDDPTNLMMINGFFQVSGVLDIVRLRATIEHRLLCFNRFTQRVVEPRLPFRSPYWETDPNFDLDAHLHHIALPKPGDDQALRDLVSDLSSTPLDFSKPLWQYHVIEGYEGGDLLFGRLHHCIADGIALIQVMLSMFDDAPDAPWPEPEEEERVRARRRGLRGLLRPAANAYSSTRKLTETMAGESLEALRHPLETTKYAVSFAKSLNRLVTLPPDPKTVFKGKLGVSNRAAWSEPVALSDIKKMGQVLGGTINDVLLTTVTAALRRYLIGREQSVQGIEVRAMVPVNLRSPEEALKLGNYFGLVVLALPVGIEDPLERLLELKRRMDELKHSAEAVVGLTIVQAMGIVPIEVERIGVEFFASKASAIMTNVPGPRQKLYLAGSRIDKMMAWVPQSGRMGIGVSIISYAGDVMLGVITDAGLVPDPEVIIAGFHSEFLQLQQEIEAVEATAYRGDVHLVDEGARGRCKAMTKAETRCKNRTQAGSAFCYTHAKIVADSEDMAH